jgi:hypothetical protein
LATVLIEINFGKINMSVLSTKNSVKQLAKVAVVAGASAVLSTGILSLFASAHAYTVTDKDREPGSYICLNNPNPKCGNPRLP